MNTRFFDSNLSLFFKSLFTFKDSSYSSFNTLNCVRNDFRISSLDGAQDGFDIIYLKNDFSLENKSTTELKVTERAFQIEDLGSEAANQ